MSIHIFISYICMCYMTKKSAAKKLLVLNCAIQSTFTIVIIIKMVTMITPPPPPPPQSTMAIIQKNRECDLQSQTGPEKNINNVDRSGRSHHWKISLAR